MRAHLGTAAAYAQSAFCLQPGGDTISRKGIVDALLLGCIPVLFHSGQRRLWPWHWGEWVANATMLIDERLVRNGVVDVVRTLAAVSSSQVEAMQRVIAQRAGRMMYAAVDTGQLPRGTLPDSEPHDAFDIAMQGALRLSRDTRRRALGRRWQQQRPRILRPGKWQHMGEHHR